MKTLLALLTLPLLALSAAAHTTVNTVATPLQVHVEAHVHAGPVQLDVSRDLGGTYYRVSNHGFDGLWRETNGAFSNGVRDHTADEANPVDTGAQVHDVCVGVGGDSSLWQAEVFYNYIPFQLTKVGLDDNAADWLAYWSSLGIDIAAHAGDLPGYCASLGGVFQPADEFVAGTTTVGQQL
jgi:hypothetical protein